jgi:PIN domain nuclease of toxin-antitoxin system
MLSGIADTHALVWYLFGDRRLSPAAKSFIDEAIAENNEIGVSSLTLAEIVYLTEKKRIPAETFTRLIQILDAPDSPLLIVPFDRHIAEALPRINRLSVPELPDRIIAATALSISMCHSSAETAKSKRLVFRPSGKHSNSVAEQARRLG